MSVSSLRGQLHLVRDKESWEKLDDSEFQREIPSHFHVIRNESNWDECVMVLPEDYREGFTYRDYRNAGYREAGTCPIADIK